MARKKKSNFSLEKKKGLHGWFSRNKGKGWVDCKTGKPCGRKSAKGKSKRGYPACRPTMAQCTSAAKKKKGPKRISWQGKAKKKKGKK
jgi:hypothetical protein|tara:strand:- start:3781 stop:4044 length:264 start_codon:yes stop_codon:yes gene_type:complete